MHVTAEPTKIDFGRLIAIVRNKNGEVQFDDYDNIPKCFHPSLTAEDWEYINQRRAE